MKTFELFCENKRSADLFWDCAKIFQETKWEPVHFTIGMFEAWAEADTTDSETREILIETLRICDEEILLENPFLQRMQQGYQRGQSGAQGGQIGNAAGRGVGYGLEKAGQLGGWLKKKWQDTSKGFMQGVAGNRIGGNQASQQPAGDDGSIQFQPGQQSEVPSEDLVDVQQVAQYFDQLLSMTQRAGMGQQYINALKGLRDQWMNGGNTGSTANDAAAARTGTAPNASSSGSLTDYQRSREAGQAVAQGKPDAYQRSASLQGDVQKIEQELEQARAAGDTRAVAELEATLKRYKGKARYAKGKATRQAKDDVAADTAGYEFM